MRIESTDASNFMVTQMHDLHAATKDQKANAKENINTSNISQLTAVERNELPVSEKVVINAIEKANKAISGANRRFEFSIHERTKEIMVKVINSETNEVIREIPPEKILDMIATIWEMAGIIVDERR